MITIKSKSEILLMREAGRIVAKAHDAIKKHIKPGITTRELDRIVEDIIIRNGAKPAFKGYQGFPASICASLNKQVVHGIPNDEKLVEGDIISIDIGSVKDGYYGDAAKTYGVGEISDESDKLITITKNSFYKGLEYMKEGYRISDISSAIQEYVESYGYSIVKEYTGHGIGREMHEAPQIPNYGLAGKGPRIKKGMVLAVEPMVNEGTDKVKLLKDGWTVVTLDGKNSAHYEHTVAITDSDPELLTIL